MGPDDLAISKEQVYELPDEQLVVAAHLIQLKDAELNLSLSPWEKQFCAGMIEHYREDARISWKQRKSLRGVLIRVADLLAHRAHVDGLLRRAEADAK